MTKTRLDELLVHRELAADLKEAAALIMRGDVFVQAERIDKPGTRVGSLWEIEIKSSAPKYVSRGGLKLEAALDRFEMDVRGLVCVDLGASTGGFTDCLLRRGARLVYAFDVGRGQLDWKLQHHPRVVMREGVNVRYLSAKMLDHSPDLVTVDLSFISVRLVLPAIRGLNPAQVLILLKPQFEAPRQKVGKGGIVRDRQVRLGVVEDFTRFTAAAGWSVHGTMASPVRGKKGNQEYFLLLAAG